MTGVDELRAELAALRVDLDALRGELGVLRLDVEGRLDDVEDGLEVVAGAILGDGVD